MTERLLSLPEPRGIAVRKADKTGYKAPNGAIYPGVTTILGATSAGKERLQQWLKRPDAEAISTAAKARGTWTHTCIENWIEAHHAGEAPPDPRHFAFGGYWRNIRPWLESHWDQKVALELPVYHPTGFAGSFDALAYVNYGENPDALCLCDWKTSKNKRDEALVEDYFCQLGAYAKGINYVYGVRPERALLVIARPSGTSPDVWELNAEELAEATSRFERRLAAYYSMPQDA
jgi:hypothetical protein